MTGQLVRDGHTITIKNNDFEEESLKQTGNIRPNRIFTAEIIDRKIGHIKSKVTEQVVKELCEIFRT